ncbi:MAG: ABC transporter ATP-binding protein [Candidatus Margulisiibacteriota bacterium]
MGIIAKNIVKTFENNTILHDISLEVREGDFISLTGRSGSGKSTLLYVLSTLDEPSSGSLEIEGKKTESMSQSDIHAFRNTHMGYVFQFHYLLPELTALENVLMPTRKRGLYLQKTEEAKALLASFDLKHKIDRLPSQLSGGEQQRVAIARALIMKPKYVFADEPTGNLDSANGDSVMAIFKEINQTLNTTIVMVTHDRYFAQQAKRTLHLLDGKLQD